MEAKMISRVGNVLCVASSFIRNCIFRVLRVGPIPNHIAFIMDGNRRYAQKKKLELDGGGGHDAGFWALMCMFLYCSELGVKYVTAYAFSIDNFQRKPEQVERLMRLMLQKIDLLTSMVNSFGVRVHFVGNLELLTADLKDATKKLMGATAGYSKSVLTICIAYDSTDEIVHAVQECCEEKCMDHVQEMCTVDHVGDDQNIVIKLGDIEKHMYMAFAPEPDIVIRTGGENRLSNFMLWQSSCSHLSTMLLLWPEIGFWQLVYAVLSFQQNHAYFEKKKKDTCNH